MRAKPSSIHNQQFKTEQEIKTCLVYRKEITDEVSLAVQQMYEENPYPRYKHADHTHPFFAKPMAEFISLETTITNPWFFNELSTPNSSPKILIAGCGTGKSSTPAAIETRKSPRLISALIAWPTQQENPRVQHAQCSAPATGHPGCQSASGHYDVIECSGYCITCKTPAGPCTQQQAQTRRLFQDWPLQQTCQAECL